jgi:hypothetical protein
MVRESLKRFIRRKKATDKKTKLPATTTASSTSQSRFEVSDTDIKSYDAARPSTVTVQRDPSQAPTTPLLATTDEHDPPKPQAELWIRAYDVLSKDDPELVAAYNTVLSSKLRPESTSDNDEVVSDTGDARLQMDRAVKEGLRRTENAVARLEKVHEGIRIVSSVKELIGKATKHSPEAAAAWAGICLLFEVGVSPATKASTNFPGT